MSINSSQYHPDELEIILAKWPVDFWMPDLTESRLKEATPIAIYYQDVTIWSKDNILLGINYEYIPLKSVHGALYLTLKMTIGINLHRISYKKF